MTTVNDTDLNRLMPGAPNSVGGAAGVSLVVVGLLLLAVAWAVGGAADWLVLAAPVLMTVGVVTARLLLHRREPATDVLPGLRPPGPAGRPVLPDLRPPGGVTNGPGLAPGRRTRVAGEWSRPAACRFADPGRRDVGRASRPGRSHRAAGGESDRIIRPAFQNGG